MTKEPAKLVELPLMSTNVRLAYSDDHESLSVRHNAPALPLFDPDSTLEIPKDVADGFLILLSSGSKSFRTIKEQKEKDKKSKNTSKSEQSAAQSPPSDETALSAEELSSIQLAFAALTDGNVIEAAFGVQSTGGIKRCEGTSEVAFNAANAAKKAITDAAISSDSVRKLAVETYVKAFEIVITYHVNLESVGIITWCIKHQKFRDNAAEELIIAFGPLNEVIASSI